MVIGQQRHRVPKRFTRDRGGHPTVLSVIEQLVIAAAVPVTYDEVCICLQTRGSKIDRVTAMAALTWLVALGRLERLWDGLEVQYIPVPKEPSYAADVR